MDEISRRVLVIGNIISGHLPLPPLVQFELAYLQLRKICEIIALACLVAHADIEKARTKDILTTYQADRIIDKLNALHDKFFPIPTFPQVNKGGQIIELIDRNFGNYLTKQDLKILYYETGKYLHRGTVAAILTEFHPEIDFSKIQNWHSKIIALLNHHKIQTINDNVFLAVGMTDTKEKKAFYGWFRQVE